MKFTKAGKIKAEKDIRIVLISVKDEHGKPFWAYVAGKPDDCVQLMADINAQKTISIGSNFAILKHGEGRAPTQEEQKIFYDEYGTHVISDEQFKEELKPYLAE